MMGTITVHEFVSLDGVFEDPSWTAPFPFDPKMGEAIGGLMGACDAILLGRRTYEMFAPAWSQRTAEDDPGAPFFNDTRKYVVSSTLGSVDWRNSTLVGPYDAGRLREIRDGAAAGIYVSGSGTLVRAMLADGLVDELHLFVYPIALGAGRRLFGEGAAPTRLALTGCEAYGSGVVHLAYGRAPAAG